MSASGAGGAGRATAIVVRLVMMAGLVVVTGVLIGLMVLPAALATDDVLQAVRTDVLDVPPLGEADTPPQNSYIYAADGTELAELNFEENRVPVTLEEIPQVALDAVLATEDVNFYEHEGVNHLAIVRAALTNFQAGGIESGASTITQQYVKMTFLSSEQTLARKVEEAIYAIQLERELSKDEILERYLNRSYFGSGVYGIGTAAQRYFSKGVGDLELGEAAMLAGLLRAPHANNPINSLENAQARRDIVLGQMASHGFVSPAQARTAIEQPLEVQISEPPAPENPFWSRWVSQLLVNESTATQLGTQMGGLDAMGATSEERRRRVFQAGLRIHTTLDLELQEEAEAALRRALTYEDEPPEEIAQEPSGAIVSVEPGTGAIRTMAVGPRDFGACAEDGSWVGETSTGELLCDRTQVNPAVPGGGGSGRQPGSAFKPILDAAALENGLSAGLVLDARGPQDIDGCPDGDGLWTVRNSGGNGVLNMYEAVARSSNVYHALVIAEIGPDRAAEMFNRLSGYQIPDTDVYCPLALGATDVTPLAMATAYATLANRGEYCAPYPIDRIEDAAGRVIWRHDPSCREVVDVEVADRVVDLLAGPVAAGGTAPVANLAPHPTRGKTGSTNDNVDAWFVGFIRQLATAAWVGYPNSERVYASEAQAQAVCGDAAVGAVCQRSERDRQLLRNVTIGGTSYGQVFGGTVPAPMWADYMRNIVDRFEPEGFPDPGPIPTAIVPDLLQAGSIAEAEELAEDAGFTLTVDEVTDWRPAGTLVSQTPEAGGELPLGGRITLGVSDGEGDLPALPDVTGRSLDEAADLLLDLGYRVFERRLATSNEALDGLVLAMSPAAGTPLAPDDSESNRVVLDVGQFVEGEDDDDGDGGQGGGGDDGGQGGGGDGGGGSTSGGPPDGTPGLGGT